MSVNRVRKVSNSPLGDFNPMTMLWDMIRTAPWQMKVLMFAAPVIGLVAFVIVVSIILALVF